MCVKIKIQAVTSGSAWTTALPTIEFGPEQSEYLTQFGQQ